MKRNARVKIHRWLLPASWFYGAGVWLRNKLFDWGWLRERSFDAPVLCVGNLAVGGTGKTPHTEYLVRLLEEQGIHVAVLSRGYRRRTRGYVLATPESTVGSIGDEPLQLKTKYPGIRVAVDADRCHGIDRLLALTNPPVEAIVLDDAYQHRYVQAGWNILLTDFSRLYCDDALLPAGRLREPEAGSTRAQMVVVTKCPPDLTAEACDRIAARLRLGPEQQLFFSTLCYGRLYRLDGAGTLSLADLRTRELEVLVLTGIAVPTPLVEEVERHAQSVELMAYPDHHAYSTADLKRVEARFRRLAKGRRIVVTTEKDAARLRRHPALPEDVRPYIYVLPLEVKILQEKQEAFNQNIIAYVRENSRNGIFPQK